MLLKDIIGICMYNWYGAGGHQGGVALPLNIVGDDLVNASGKWVSTIRALSKFKLHRAFVDNWVMVRETQPPFTISTNPTEQNFYFDEFFKLQKANGITNIWSASGCFDWYVPALGGKSQRKSACYDPTKQPTDPTAWADLAELCKQIAYRYSWGELNGLLDYIQVLNEWDFRWNVPRIITPEEYAVGFYECYKAIRSVSATQKIMVGCTLTPEMQTITRLFAALDKLSAAEGKPKVRDVVVTFNLYSRTDSVNQGSGIGATYEEVNQFGRFLNPLNDFCKQEGLKFACTETGHNSSPSTSASAMKNKAPALEGYTIEEAQGILAVRTGLIYASLSECVGVTFYHTKDGYEAEPFTYHGFCYDKDFGGKEDWSAKPARTIVETFLAQYGERRVTAYRKNTDFHAVDLTGATDTITLVWTDKKKIGSYDAMPRIGTLPTPNTPPPNPTPTPTTMIIGISTKADRSDFAILSEAKNLAAGNYYIEARQATPTVSFSLKKDGIVVKTQSENGAPYDLAGGQPYNLTAGDYELTVKDKATPAGIVISFTVGAVAPPTPAKEPVTETWIENGKVFFKTAVKTYSTAVQ